ncbi:MAG: hypothetical protein WBY94_09510, partial [Polyangiaceae bacterium]
SPAQAVAAVNVVVKYTTDLGMELNRSKSEWFSLAPPPQDSVCWHFKRTSGSIKLLGANIGALQEYEVCDLNKRLSGKSDLFFERLSKIRGNIATALLGSCGVPLMSYVVRTHEPAVSRDLALAFDAKVQTAWSSMAGIVPDKANVVLAHLPCNMGGMGFSRNALIADAAYTASRNTALDLDGPRLQRTLTESANASLARELAASGPHLARLLEQCSMSGTSAWFRSPLLHVNPDDFSAAMRLRLGTPSKNAPATASCPGCRRLMEIHDWMEHVTCCALLKGYNASSRHAGLKTGFKRMCSLALVPVDQNEPREYAKQACPGCKVFFEVDGIEAHKMTCPLITSGAIRSTVTHTSGPDIRCYPGRTYTIDVTVIGSCCPSMRATKLEQLFKEKATEKRNRYAAACEERGEEFVVAAVSSCGHIAKEFRAMISTVCGAANKLDHFQESATLSTLVVMGSGHALRTAELKRGIAPRSSVSANHAEPYRSSAHPQGSEDAAAPHAPTIPLDVPAPNAATAALLAAHELAARQADLSRRVAEQQLDDSRRALAEQRAVFEKMQAEAVGRAAAAEAELMRRAESSAVPQPAPPDDIEREAAFQRRLFEQAAAAAEAVAAVKRKAA